MHWIVSVESQNTSSRVEIIRRQIVLKMSGWSHLICTLQFDRRPWHRLNRIALQNRSETDRPPEWLPFHSYWSFCRLTSSSTNISFGNRWGDDACTTIARSLPVVIDGDNTWWCWGGLCECKADGWLNWLNSICHFYELLSRITISTPKSISDFFLKMISIFL